MEQRGDYLPVTWIRNWLQRSCNFHDPCLKQSLWGLNFLNPVGLAAGFDKDGVAAGIWSNFGFGFAELGTVTLHRQPGNPCPRLFRLPLDQAAINRMGFNNQGAAQMAAVLRQSQQRQPWSIPIGINLGKSKITALDKAVEDYLSSFRLLKELGDYFVVNISSPNTPGLRSLQAREQLGPILATIQQENQANKPLLVKIAPDLAWKDIAAILVLAEEYHLAGIIATNTTVSREGLKTQILETTGNSVHIEAGGLSGAPLRQHSTDVIRFIWQQTEGRLPIVGVGGIFTVEDAWEKIIAGASLLQVYTGWIYEGPWMVRRILEGVQKKLQEQGLSTLSNAVGLGKG
jgi:dihydroorotate dehydrogenase